MSQSNCFFSQKVDTYTKFLINGYLTILKKQCPERVIDVWLLFYVQELRFLKKTCWDIAEKNGRTAIVFWNPFVNSITQLVTVTIMFLMLFPIKSID